MSTFKVLYPVKRAFKGHKVGHAGTLDPDAHGLVIAAVGKATRLLSFLEAEDKCYEFILNLGVETDSYDAEGEITARHDNAAVTMAAVESAFQQFLGEIDQMPPIYSAIKIDGKRACDRVRKGETVTLKTRKITIHSLELLETIDDVPKTEFRIRCNCTKGTYIRSLGFDLGKALGSGAHVSDIKRTAIGASTLDQSVSAEDSALTEHLISPEKLIPQIECITVPDEWLKLLKNGIKIETHKFVTDGMPFKEHQKYFILNEQAELQMYAETDAELLRPKVQLVHEQ